MRSELRMIGGSSAIFKIVTLKRLKDNFVLVSRRSESRNLSELLIVITGKNCYKINIKHNK